MTFDVESVKQSIPYYLSAEDQKVLVKELQSIAGGTAVCYVLNEYQDSFKAVMLQGDGWKDFKLFLFETGERRAVQGMVLSNSCDMDPENPRDVPARLLFAPLVKLAAFKALLDASAIDAAKIDAKIASIKAQKTSNIFFLPSGGILAEDYIVRFDDAHSMPVAAHQKSQTRTKLFTLSNTGFYMLVLKLSVHFCRLQERVNRSQSSASMQETNVAI